MPPTAVQQSLKTESKKKRKKNTDFSQYLNLSYEPFSINKNIVKKENELFQREKI